MFCSNCGKEYSDSLPCCPHCTPSTQQNTPVQPTEHLFPYPHTLPEQPKKKSKLPLIIIAIVLVAAIAAGAILLPGLLKKDDTDTESNSETVTVWALTSVNVGA